MHIFSPCSYGQFPKVVVQHLYASTHTHTHTHPLEIWGTVLVVGVIQQMVSLVLLLLQLAFFYTQCSVLEIRPRWYSSLGASIYFWCRICPANRLQRSPASSRAWTFSLLLTGILFPDFHKHLFCVGRGQRRWRRMSSCIQSGGR